MVRSTNKVDVAMWNFDTLETMEFCSCNRYYARKKIQRLAERAGWQSDDWDYAIVDAVLGTIIN